MFAPIITIAAGVYWPEVTAVLTVLAVIRLAGSRRLLVWLLEARPLTDADAPELRRRAPELTRRSNAPEPELMCTDVEGGRWANALAIAHPSSPAVVFSRPLLAAAHPDQLVAIYGHEIAHLEHYTPRILRRRTILLCLLTAAALALVPVSKTLVSLPWWSGLAWLGAAFLGLMVAQAKHRGHETASDLRAVELCGDAEAVASALILLHQLNLFPRRMDQAQDSNLSHPSLAQRLRAIRADNGPSESTAYEPTRTPFPVIVAGLHPGHHLLLERDRMTWLEGVDAAAEQTPDGLRAGASSTRSWTYDRLTELRVDTRRRGQDQLIAVEEGGTRRRFSISGDAVARLQLALDEVDGNLAAPTLSPFLAPFAHSGALNRAMAFVAGLLAVIVPGHGAISIPLFVAAAWPRVPALTAAAAATATGLAVGLLRPPPTVASLQPTPTVHLLLAVVGVILGGAAFARDRLHPTERDRAPWLVESLLGLCLAGSWSLIAIRIAATGEGEITAYPLHAAVVDTPSTVILPLTLAAVLLLRRSRPLRVAAIACTLVAAITVWIGSADFRVQQIGPRQEHSSR
jgi:Zn-dependent protease with chaperone function